MRSSISDLLWVQRTLAILLGAFGVLALVLSMVGMYGVISYTVGQRTREIGVRLALGATGSGIARLVLGNGIRLAFAGIVLGLAGSVVATRLIQSTLYGVPRLDPFAFGAGAVVMLLLGVIACLAPTRRAASLDPVVALPVDG